MTISLISLKRFLLLSLLLFSVFGSGSLGAEEAGTPTMDNAGIFQEANLFFTQANELLATDAAKAAEFYRKAVLRYERLVAAGIRNGRLYYNIGNVYYRLGDIGRAVLNYRRAEQYIANDVNLMQNLDYVLKQRQDTFEVKQKEKVLKTLFFWHYDLSAGVRASLFAFCYVLFWVFLGIRLFVRKTWLHWCMAVFLLLILFFAGSLCVEYYRQSSNVNGVLVAGEVVARKGDGQSYQPSFAEPLHSGAEFVLLEKRGEWLHIELRDGRRTWVPSQSAELVRQ
jgi:tetratricopeptide (TPR) repeat protein